MLLNKLRPALVLLVLFTLITGLLYPLAVTVTAQAVFPAQANGSILQVEGQIVGSVWIGQPFTDPGYFWPRSSATTPLPYNAAASGGSNLAPTSPVLLDAVAARIVALRAADPENNRPIPVDLVTASASGLDPHISPAAAEYQLLRVARVRGLDPATVRELVRLHTEGRQWGLFGEPRVHVLTLNLALDAVTANSLQAGQPVETEMVR